MKAKRRMLISMLAIVFVLLAVVATVAIAFALTQQTITTTLNIGYTVEDIDGSASATYTIGGVTNYLEPIADAEHVSQDNRSLIFKADDTQYAGNLMFPEGQIPLTAQNDNIVIQYTYSNTGAKHYIASMSFDSELVADNMKVEYSIDGTTYSENRYAVVVPANTANKSYWIRISIDNKAKSASFTGDFNWLLSGCDEQEDSYLSLTSVEFQGSNGSYSASLANTGSYVGELVFPSSVNNDPVTTIAQNTSLTQEQKNQVTSVYIPDSVETIGSDAFRGYQNLQTVTFEQNETAGASVQGGTGLTSIGECAFVCCYNLREFIIPNTVTTISSSAFDTCTNLANITIGSGVTSIGNCAFAYCTGLTSITVASGNTKYHSSGNCLIETASKTLIQGCKTSVIPTDGSVTVIGNGALYGCTSLTGIAIPNSVTSIGDQAFYGCTGLTRIELPSSLTSISSYAFYDCTNLRTITFNTLKASVVQAMRKIVNQNGNVTVIIGENITEIPNFAFCDESNYETAVWTGMTSIKLHNNITYIGSAAFYRSGLTSIWIPASVTTIYDSGPPTFPYYTDCDVYFEADSDPTWGGMDGTTHLSKNYINKHHGVSYQEYLAAIA